MLRILMISQSFWPEDFRINQIAADLIRAGVQLTVLTGQPNYPEGKIFPGYRPLSAGCEDHEAGYKIVRVPLVPRGRGGGLRLILNYASFLIGGIVIGGWLVRGAKFDVVFVYGNSPVTQGFIAIWIGWLKRAPVVQWIQDLWPDALSATGHVRSPIILGTVGCIVRFMYRQSDLVLAQSRSIAAYLIKQAAPVPVRYFPNPGEHQRPLLGAGRRLLPVGFNIVFAGNLGRAQALDTVIAAAARLTDLHDVRIHLFGSGSMTAWLKQEISRLGLANVMLPGRVTPAEIASIYNEADALLLTLVGDPMVALTVPSKLQSYLAAGRPIIAAADGEAAKIVGSSGSGLCCSAGDPQQLASTIRHMYALTQQEREQLGASGRQYFEAHYQADVLTQKLVDGLTKVAAGDRMHAFRSGD